MDQTYPTPGVHAAPAYVAAPRTPIAGATRAFVLAVAFGVAAQALFYGHAGGLNAPVAVAALLLAAWLVRPPRAGIDPLDVPLPVAAIVLAAAAALRAEPMLIAGDALLAVGLALASLPAIAGVAVVRGSARVLGQLSVAVVAIVGFGAAWVLADARPWSAPVRRLRSGTGRAAPVLRGLLIAAPFLVLFAVVFSAADAVFARLLRAAFDWHIDLGDIPGRALLAVSAAWLAGGVLAVAAGAATHGVDDTVRAAAPSDDPGSAGHATATDTQPAAPLPRLAPLEVAVALIAIDALFLLFVVLQGTYLFGGRDTVAAAGLTYAEYARRGFVELLLAASVAGVLLLALEALVARRTRLYLVAALALVALTACVLASSLWRLRLYQDAYGWTELRVYVIVAIAWLTLGLGAGAVALLADRSRWMPHALVALGLVVAVVTTAVGPQRFSAEQNVARALNPALVPEGGRSGLDSEYLATLGDDAVPVLVAAVPRLDERTAAPIERLLARRRAALANDPALAGWPAWNLAREEARRALGLR